MSFSRSDRRIGGTNLSRIDRMYISDFFGDRGGTIVILSGTCMSDHSPVMLVMSKGERRTSSSLRIPESLQTEEQFAGQIEQLWSQLRWQPGSSLQTLAIGLQQSSSLLREEASRRLAQTWAMERSLHCSVASLQRQLESHPDSEWLGG